MQGEAKSRQQPISRLTRKKIVESLSGTNWFGDLDELEFLSRLYDLKSLPSNDPRHHDAEGDVARHRIANLDWDDDWVFWDERFGLNDDGMLLRFLAEMVHPEVRESDEAQRLVRVLNAHLMRDGWELIQISKLSEYPVYGYGGREKSVAKVPEHFPLDIELLIASIAEVFKYRGRARELAILANSTYQVEEASYDNWNGGTRGWGLTCGLDASLYARLSSDDREESETAIKDIASESFRPHKNDFLERVVLTPLAFSHNGWRSAANEWLSGKGISNQGRVRSDNIASLECDGLLFRSSPEINLYRALKRLGVTFAPLPVFLRGGESYSRLEPDFVVLKDGRVLVVEVDGDTYHRESPVDAHQRLLPLDHEGAKIERVKADECETFEKARQCAERLIQIIDRLAKRH